LEDKVFNAFISGHKSIVPVSFEKAADNTNTQATNIERGLKLDLYDSEIIIDIRIGFLNP